MAQAIKNAGCQGVSVEPADDSSNDVFDNHWVTRIVLRAVEKGQEERLHVKSPEHVAISRAIGIRFCPWCGKRLEESKQEA